LQAKFSSITQFTEAENIVFFEQVSDFQVYCVSYAEKNKAIEDQLRSIHFINFTGRKLKPFESELVQFKIISIELITIKELHSNIGEGDIVLQPKVAIVPNKLVLKQGESLALSVKPMFFGPDHEVIISLEDKVFNITATESIDIVKPTKNGFVEMEGSLKMLGANKRDTLIYPFITEYEVIN